MFGVYNDLYVISKLPVHNYSNISKEACRMYNS